MTIALVDVYKVSLNNLFKFKFIMHINVREQVFKLYEILIFLIIKLLFILFHETFT